MVVDLGLLYFQTLFTVRVVVWSQTCLIKVRIWGSPLVWSWLLLIVYLRRYNGDL